MPAWLLPAITAIGAVGGSLATNQSNRNMSREQMRFQERMSSTAAQRAVEDYRKAGLNPALAYERPASTPGGASMPMENVIGAGISSARDTARLRSELRIQAETERRTRAEADLAQAQSQVYRTQNAQWMNPAYQAEWARWQMEHLRNQRALLPVDLQLAQAQALWQQYQNATARNEARFQEGAGILAPILQRLPLVSPMISPIGNLVRRKPMIRTDTEITRDFFKGGMTEFRRVIPKEIPR